MLWRRFRIPACLIFGLVLVYLLHSTELVLARAGDGGSYGGGGGGGGSGGSGGGGSDIDGLIMLIRLVFMFPKIGVPAVIVVAAFIYYSSNAAQSGYVGHTIRKAMAYQNAALQRQTEGDRQQALAAIRSRDPAFDEERFLERVSTAFVGIQQAWSQQHLAPVRAFISDGIRERFSLQFEMQQALGIRNQMDDVRVLERRVAAVASDTQFDTMHVMILAQAADYDVSLASGQRVGRAGGSDSWTEYWSFHRRPGAMTLAQPGALEGHCPHCGVQLQIVDRTICPSCSSTVNSGDYDWVLAEITQAQEWRVAEPAGLIPGVPELCSSDPGFSLQHIEDRVSVMFWRLRAAEFFGNARYAVPVLSESLATQFQSSVHQTSRTRTFWRRPAVGMVELIDCEPGKPGDMDRLRVHVRWSGTKCAGDPCGSHKELLGQAIYNTAFVLTRLHGVQSVPGHTFSSASCPQCGAAIAVTAEAACQYCGTSLVDGRFDWVLDTIEPYTAEMAARRREQNRTARGGTTGSLPIARTTDPESELSLAVLVHVMRADGTLDEREQRALMKLGARRGLSADQVATVINTSALEDVDLPLPRDSKQALQYVEQLVWASLADGNVSAQEKRFLYAYAARMQIARADVNHTIARIRKEGYQAARRVLRKKRTGRGAPTDEHPTG